jgi:SM-20-related protein
MSDIALDSTLATIIHGLAERGWVITHDFLTREEWQQLATESRQRWQAGEFHQAGVGHGGNLKVRNEVRSDDVLWLEPPALSPAQQRYFDRLEQLRQAINANLYLGLFEFEGHFAIYPPGSFYKRHSDQFHGVELRTVTCVYYLNNDWREEDGGQLRIYHDDQGHENHFDVLPTGGTLVTFLSGVYEHEVLPARRERLSLTGWFRKRGQ